MIRRSLTGVAVLLALFHAYLFAWQVSNGELAEPGVIARWLVAALLVRGLMAGRRHQSMIWGRKALCIWLLAALLHGPALARAGESPFTLPPNPPAVAAVLQIAVTIGLGLAFMFAAWASRRHASLAWRRAAAMRLSRARVACCHSILGFAPRPPPVLPRLQ